MYQDNIKQLQSINDPDTQYQKQDENDIQCKLDTTNISTTTGTSPMHYDLQGIYNRATSSMERPRQLESSTFHHQHTIPTTGRKTTSWLHLHRSRTTLIFLLQRRNQYIQYQAENSHLTQTK
eukprot:scaffold60451_cov32-Attheya_sp.AAC.1